MLCGYFGNQRRVVFVGSAAAPVQNIHSNIAGSKVGVLLLRLVVEGARRVVFKVYPAVRGKVCSDDTDVTCANKRKAETAGKVYEELRKHISTRSLELSLDGGKRRKAQGIALKQMGDERRGHSLQGRMSWIVVQCRRIKRRCKSHRIRKEAENRKCREEKMNKVMKATENINRMQKKKTYLIAGT